VIRVGGGHAFGASAIFLKAFLFNCTFDSFELLQIQYEDERLLLGKYYVALVDYGAILDY
jgi:hypothetical protein